jgi:cytohesin
MRAETIEQGALTSERLTSEQVRPVQRDAESAEIPKLSGVAPAALAGFHLMQLLAIAWIAGCGVYLALNLLRVLRINYWLWRKRKVLPAKLQQEIKNLLSGYGFTTFPRIWLVHGIGQPFVWGLLRGSIYLPANFGNITDPEHRRSILGHELSHVLRFDATVNFLQVIGQAIFWFHPLVWWANKKIRTEREKCCDEVAVARLNALPKDYSSAIVEILAARNRSTRPVPSLAVAGPVKDVEERIRTMLRPGKKFYKRPSLIVATIAVVIALVTVPTAFVLTTRAQEQPSRKHAGASKSLHQAAKDGNLEQVTKLIAAGADVNARDNRSQTPLHFAARNGHEEIARLLIAGGADVNVNMGDESWTPLLDAASKGHTKLVKLLLEKGAKVDVGDDYGYTPLYYAIWSNDEESVRMLIAAGADVDKRPSQRDPYNPLFYAVWMDDANLVKAFIDAGADVNYKDKDGWTPLHYAISAVGVDVAKLFVGTDVTMPDLHKAAFEGNLDKVRQLLERGTEVDTRDDLGWTASFWALSAGHKDVFQYLLSKGADVTARTNGGRTLLHQASKAGFTDIFNQLIAKGADVNLKDKDGETPLQHAASEGHKEVVKLLVAKGADINVAAKNGRHPLGDAALAGHEDVVKLLIASGADVNLNAKVYPSSEQYRGTALHAAASGGHSKILGLLIAKGADVNINSTYGTPLHLANRGRSKRKVEDCAQIVEKLLAKGADVNARASRHGRTPLHNAARWGHYKAAKLLITAGADVNAKDKEGHTPLWHANDRHTPAQDYSKIVELLRRHGAVESLHDAAEAGDITQVKRLISKGADVNAKTDGWLITPMHVAADKGHKEICELLIREGAEVNARTGELEDDGGLTPLHVACDEGHQEVVRLLLAHGAAVNAKTKHSKTPLDVAKDHQQIVELLEKYGAKEGISLEQRFKNAKLISPGTWLEGSFQYRTDEQWFAIDVVKNKSYSIYYDDEFGTGKYSADIDAYMYKHPADAAESKHCLFTDRHNVYRQPIKFAADYNGKLYLRLVSDNPRNTTFAIKCDTDQ